VEGPIPDDMADLFQISRNNQSIGIVMRYEAGGTLTQYLHGNDGVNRKLTLAQKLHLLENISIGLADLHSVNIIHGDIKPDNILLDNINTANIKLADFGLSTVSNTSTGQSTLLETKHMRGTPIYAAPEMVINPFAQVHQASTLVAKSSRKTDM
jgi:serine/threonine-protein kinase